MSYLHAVILGLIQGLTEFLPVSSSGHLAIVQSLLPGFEQPGVLFDVLLHTGTMVAVLLYFRRDVFHLLRAPFRPQGEDAQTDRKTLALLILTMIPTGIIGLCFKDFFAGLFHNLPVVSAMLLITGTLLFFTEKKGRGRRDQQQMTWQDALWAGLAQSAAILPGISRSGSTIACLLLRGIDGPTAARFSFLMMIPAVGGATLLSLGDIGAVPAAEVPAYLAGMLVSFFTGWIAIDLLMAVVRHKRLIWFALYCWLIGGTFLLLSLH